VRRRLAYARSAIIAVVALLVALSGGVAHAYWAAIGSGSAAATTATLNPPTALSAPAISGNTVHVTWTASAGTPAATGYYVTRTDQANSSASPACGTTPTLTIPSTSCDDLSVPSGNYRYTATAVYHTWTATSAVSNTVAVRTASKLAFTAQPSTTAAGAAISPAIAVTVEDVSGNAVPVAGTSITVAIGTNPAGGTLSGTLTAATDANGVATFGALSIDRAGAGYTLLATGGALTGATSAAFTVTAAAAATFAITSAPVSGAASSSATLGPITIQRQDGFGNPVTAPTSVTVNLASNSAGTKVFATSSGGAAITTATIPPGASSVTVYYGDTKAGTPTITVTGSLTSATQTETIAAGPASALCFVSTTDTACILTTQSVGSGGTFSGRVQLVDSFRNPVVSATTISVTLTSSGDLQTPIPASVTIAAGQSVSGTLSDKLNNGSSKSGTLTAHATSVGTDATIQIHA
jgi:hypothetical protein